jgi:para-aminobenzoate synthetase component 1
MKRRRTGVVLPLSWRDPVTAFAPLAEEPWALALLSGGEQSAARWSILCAQPERIIETSGRDGLVELANPSPKPVFNQSVAHFPFTGGWAGLLHYEWGRELEGLPVRDCAQPQISFGYYTKLALFDHVHKQAFVLAPDLGAAKRFSARLGREKTLQSDMVVLHRLVRHESDQKVAAKVAKTIQYIEAGDIFQANISRSFSAELRQGATPFEVFSQMIRASAAPFSAYLRVSERRAVLSNSPERFLSVTETGEVETHPIKGTRPRGKTKAQDRKLAEELQKSAKDRAENLMIVDLMRNDLSRVCEAGSIRVPELFALQSFANVHHLVSTVRGQLRPGIGVMELLQASFPPGSITGAPKIRAMEIIDELEQTPRGPYCGALGYISDHGKMDFNVLIRTLHLHKTPNRGWQAEFRAGGGIVADSDPMEEAAEMNDKASVFTKMAGANS